MIEQAGEGKQVMSSIHNSHCFVSFRSPTPFDQDRKLERHRWITLSTSGTAGSQPVVLLAEAYRREQPATGTHVGCSCKCGTASHSSP